LSRQIGGDVFNPTIFNTLEKKDFGNQIATHRLTFLLTGGKEKKFSYNSSGEFQKISWGMMSLLEIPQHLQHLYRISHLR
jgi:hypothetical protein